LYIEW